MRGVRIFVQISLTMGLLLLGVVAALSQEAAVYRVNANAPGGSLNIRSGPGTGHDVVVSVPAGSKGVIVYRCRPADDGSSKNPFCQAKWAGYSGWISSCCITLISADQQFAGGRIDLERNWAIELIPFDGVTQDCSDAAFQDCEEFSQLIGSSYSNYGAAQFQVERSKNGQIFVSSSMSLAFQCTSNDWTTTSQGDVTLRCLFQEADEEVSVLLFLDIPGFVTVQMIAMVTEDPNSCRYSVRDLATFTQVRVMAICEPV